VKQAGAIVQFWLLSFKVRRLSFGYYFPSQSHATNNDSRQNKVASDTSGVDEQPVVTPEETE
jgi:hypothetical protein